MERLSCAFRLEGGGEVLVTVVSPVPAPAYGERLTLIFDPERPASAATAQYLRSFRVRLPYVFLAGFVSLVAAVVLIATVFS
ncbi:hypothetical protein AB0C52_25980 [Streptomyces sp. NPDC048717]|uniref:hypothetical protein n=1 Tax=Streptomyces sp. NPDC048717 TaxID=3154928 RepID=UPI00343249D9